MPDTPQPTWAEKATAEPQPYRISLFECNWSYGIPKPNPIALLRRVFTASTAPNDAPVRELLMQRISKLSLLKDSGKLYFGAIETKGDAEQWFELYFPSNEAAQKAVSSIVDELIAARNPTSGPSI